MTKTLGLQILNLAVAGICLTRPGITTAEEKPPGAEAWNKTATLGLSLAKGNSDNMLFNGAFLAGRKWEQNELRLGADANYGESSKVRNQQSLHGFVQDNILFSQWSYGMLRADALHDAVANLQYRLTLSPGYGYYLVKKEETKLSFEVGPSVIIQKQGGLLENYLGLRLGERWDQKLSDRATLWQTAELLPKVSDFNQYLFNFEIGVQTDITPKLSLRAFIQDAFNSQPAAGRKKNDVRFVTGLGYKF